MGVTHRLQVVTAAAVVGLLAASCGGGDGGEADAGATADDTETTAQAESPEATASEATTPEETAESESGGSEAADDTDMGDPVTLTLGHPFPPTHVIQADVLEPWAQEVSDATNGTVTIEIIPGGGLGPAPAMYENTVSGAQDLGWALQGYTAGRFPLTQIVEMPFRFDTATAATNALWDLYEEFPEFQAEYDDVKVLGLWTHDAGHLWTSGTQVTSIDDLSGLVMRAPGPVQQSLLETLGASPTGMPAPEIYDSLERGVIDGMLISNSGIDSFGLYDVVDYGLECNCYVAAMFLVANQDAWQGLSQAQQDAVEPLIGRAFSLRGAEAYDADNTANIGAIEDAIEMTQIPDDEADDWQAVGEEVATAWAAERDDAGLPGSAMVESLDAMTE